MNKNHCFLGIDIGTSSIKVMKYEINGEILVKTEKYMSQTIKDWNLALINALKSMDLSNVFALSFSSQVGTYIIDDCDVIPWNASCGTEELAKITREISEDTFLEEISMVHPPLISYPLPKYLYIKRTHTDAKKVCMPKDYFIEQFTGNYVADKYSYRGIANLEKCEYSKKLLETYAIDFNLPKLFEPNDLAGYTTKKAEKIYGIKENTPVYVGINDFFAGLLGMGITENNTCFEVAGTSEHIGKISKNLSKKSPVSGPYLYGNANYGGTKSSGKCCDFALKNFETDNLSLSLLNENPPIFLPYLQGERAPIFDENARGVFFGISDKTDKRQLAYSVFEGVVFGLYDILSKIDIKEGDRMIIGGGSAINPFISKLKSVLFKKKIIHTKINDISALGAVIIAMVGSAKFKDYKEAIQNTVIYEKEIQEDDAYFEKLFRRFKLFQKLYKNLKENFVEFHKIKELK